MNFADVKSHYNIEFIPRDTRIYLLGELELDLNSKR